ncbi:hypothetical protein A2995_01825 [Candidatus Nomurabacteria bacterium RIFCSPLOWO2_01_FULL_33_24]|uniref:Pseudouridine synthase n=1 Tax=Candidatus Nomurabacteria bacterium RIFCSPLOWO2_01_FULL_33_24 TaxID=1801765 RepID=A0A1F6X1S0_9BACT|nr:MAG: hypothetical protein A2995_01825 [Candidatus Nomurabacteria bacterium RIFCSPLOWO2_01_FULL_33_24]
MNLKDKILYEDNDLLVVNKPAGLAVHSNGRTEEKTLVDFLLEKYPEIKNIGDNPIRPGIVHRLDKDTSGVLIIVKNQKSFLFLKEQFQNREVKKVYQAVVWGWLKDNEGMIDKPIGKSRKDFRLWSAQRGARGELRDAITKYKVLKYFKVEKNKFSLVEVYPKTGRTHQIRVHFKYLSNPIVCDLLYAPKRVCPIIRISRLALQAVSIEFKKPDGGILKIEAPLSENIQIALDKAL